MRRDLKNHAEEFQGWLENYGRKDQQELLKAMGRFLASVPGGEAFEDAGYEPYQGMGWKEFEMITDLLQSVDSKRDVEDLAEFFLGGGDSEEESED